MARQAQQRDPEPSDATKQAEPADDTPKTWWDRNGALVIAAGAFALVVLLIVFNMK